MNMKKGVLPIVFGILLILMFVYLYNTSSDSEYQKEVLISGIIVGVLIISGGINIYRNQHGKKSSRENLSQKMTNYLFVKKISLVVFILSLVTLFLHGTFYTSGALFLLIIFIFIISLGTFAIMGILVKREREKKKISLKKKQSKLMGIDGWLALFGIIFIFDVIGLMYFSFSSFEDYMFLSIASLVNVVL